MSESDRLDIAAIMRQLPHRYPFLLVDRVLECVAGQHCLALKNVTVNEPFFQGHFPHRPVMPGVLIIEAMAQTAGAICLRLVIDESPSLVYLMTVDGAKFRKPVVPGDQMRIHVKKIKKRGNILKFACEAKVDGATVAEAEVAAMMVPKE